jgi:hypothetical protein
MDSHVSIVEGDPDTTYLLPFGSGYYHVPVENVVAKPMRTNCKSCVEIDAVVRSSVPEAWKRSLTFGRIMRIRGVEGNALYTTFAPTDGCFDEQRVLRLVPWRVAHACFAEVKEWARCNPTNRFDATRMAIYDWKKEVDLPGAPHLNPVLNNWPEARLEYTVVLRTPGQMVPYDPMADWDAHVDDQDAMAAQRAAVQVTELARLQLPRLPRIPRPQSAPPDAPSPPSRQSEQDLRTLSDFLFECKDLVPEGAYLDASNALQRVWNSAI